jgi:hypothetical protein
LDAQIHDFVALWHSATESTIRQQNGHLSTIDAASAVFEMTDFVRSNAALICEIKETISKRDKREKDSTKTRQKN